MFYNYGTFSKNEKLMIVLRSNIKILDVIYINIKIWVLNM